MKKILVFSTIGFLTTGTFVGVTLTVKEIQILNDENNKLEDKNKILKDKNKILNDQIKDQAQTLKNQVQKFENDLKIKNKIVINKLDPKLKKWKEIIQKVIDHINKNNDFDFKIPKINIYLGNKGPLYRDSQVYLLLSKLSEKPQVIFQLSHELMHHLIFSSANDFYNSKGGSKTHEVVATAYSFILLKELHYHSYLNNEIKRLNSGKALYSKWKNEINKKYKNWKDTVKEIHLAAKNWQKEKEK